MRSTRGVATARLACAYLGDLQGVDDDTGGRARARAAEEPLVDTRVARVAADKRFGEVIRAELDAALGHHLREEVRSR